MNPNINLHIDSIVLDGLDLAPSEAQLLQQAVISQLTEMLTQQSLGGSLHTDSSSRTRMKGNPINVGTQSDAMSIGPQLANAIFANVPQSAIGSSAWHGGQS